MKIKILIVIDSLRIGGIQSSLKNLLEELNSDKIEVFLFSFSEENLENLPKHIKILKSNKLLSIINTRSNEYKTNKIINTVIRKFMALLAFIFGSRLLYTAVFKTIRIKDKFDVAISYTNNVNTRSLYFGANKFVLKRVEAIKKITFLHVDYQKMKLNNKINNHEYSSFDQIVCVSHAVRNTFLKFNPDLRKKTKVIYNIVDSDKIFILSKADDEENKIVFDSNKLNLITVARMDSNKNPLESIIIANELIKRNVNFKWYFLGDGRLKERFIFEINKHHLEKHIILLGEKLNPYTYLSQSDCYISLSKSESYGISIIEALILNKVVIAMEYPAIHEIINNNENGFIVTSTTQIIDILTNFNINTSKIKPFFIQNKMEEIDKIYELLE